MHALIVVDAQNEFSEKGQRSVPMHIEALNNIRSLVQQARSESRPIAWVQHYNKPNESAAFIPGSWGAELSAGLGPESGHGSERLFVKDVFGAFTGTGLEEWLRSVGATGVQIVGFYTHMCVSTTTREALNRGFDVEVVADATGTCDLNSQIVGSQSADEVRRSALLHLESMGARITRTQHSAHASRFGENTAIADGAASH